MTHVINVKKQNFKKMDLKILKTGILMMVIFILEGI